MKESVDVHDAHCCKNHGCKYMDENCTVMSGQNEGIECEECYEEPNISKINLANGSFDWNWIGENSPFDKGSLVFSKNSNGEIEIVAPGLDKEFVRMLMISFAENLVNNAKF